MLSWKLYYMSAGQPVVKKGLPEVAKQRLGTYVLLTTNNSRSEKQHINES